MSRRLRLQTQNQTTGKGLKQWRRGKQSNADTRSPKPQSLDRPTATVRTSPPTAERSGNAQCILPKRKWLPKGRWTEHIGYKGIEQVQGNPSVHEIGQGMKGRNTVAVTTSRNEWADNNLNRSVKSRFGNLMPFNEAFLDECQLAHQAPRTRVLSSRIPSIFGLRSISVTHSRMAPSRLVGRIRNYCCRFRRR